MLIFDNANDENVLIDYWPVASKGCALITTRNHNLAFQPADTGIEILPFGTEAGSGFLLHLLSLDIADKLTVQEAKSAHELSERLSGHALAISQMAGLIHRRSWSIEEFLAIYDKNTQKIHGSATGDSLDTVWYLSFKSLEPECSAFLGVLCYVSPDSIPQELFESTAALPPGLELYQDTMK